MLAKHKQIKLTAGWSKVPNSFVENVGVLSHGELVLSLMVMRRGNGKPITDRIWQEWTGLSPRMLEYATAQLIKRGLLRVEGKGSKARYSWVETADVWQQLVLQWREDGATKAKIVDRPKRPASPQHPDCKARGCALQYATSNGLVSVCESTPVVSSEVAKPVSQTRDVAADLWPKTLETVQGLFPLAGVAFLVRLVGGVRRIYRDISDGELAASVTLAWEKKKRVQKSEGLFLLTVPEAVRISRKQPKAAAAVELPGARGVKALLNRASEALTAAGEPFALEATTVQALSATLPEGEIPIEQLEQLDNTLGALERTIIETGAGVLDEHRRGLCLLRVEAESARYRGRMSEGQLKEFQSQVFGRSVLELLGVPHLSVFYA